MKNFALIETNDRSFLRDCWNTRKLGNHFVVLGGPTAEVVFGGVKHKVSGNCHIFSVKWWASEMGVTNGSPRIKSIWGKPVEAKYPSQVTWIGAGFQPNIASLFFWVCPERSIKICRPSRYMVWAASLFDFPDRGVHEWNKPFSLSVNPPAGLLVG